MTPQEIEQALEECIWHAQMDRLLSLPDGRTSSWSGSVQRQMRAFGRAPDLSPRVAHHSPYPQCAAILMVKDEADIITHNLEWLYFLGIRRFALIDNDSHDGTADLIRLFRDTHTDATVLIEHDDVVAHFQTEKTMAMCRLARAAWPDVEWIVPVDADEFLQARSGLRSLLFVPEEVEALTVPKVVHFQTRGPTEADVFARMKLRSLPFAVPPKVIFRANANLSVAKGNHWVVTAEGRPVRYDGALHYGMFHREFQTRSFPQFLSKVRNGGTAVLAANALGHEVGGQHWLAWHALLAEGGEAALRVEFERVAFRQVGEDYIMDELKVRTESGDSDTGI